MAMGFYFDMTACIGCKTCQIACKDKNDLDVGTLFRHVVSYEVGEYPTADLFHMSVSCNHCENPACVAKCPTGAMYKSEEGPVLHDDSMCIGCQACVTACPYSVPKFIDKLGIVQKCDSCASIRAAGGEPQCVSSCPMRALEFGDISELMKKHPDAVMLTDLRFMPESDTMPTTLVTPRKKAIEMEASEVIL